MDQVRERIRDRAFSFWENDGRPEGRAWEHWLRAETEIASERTPTAKKRATSRRKKAPVSARKANGRKRK